MAKYTPNGWKMSADGERRFREVRDRVEAIVSNRARKYQLPGMTRDDIMQEGRFAAAYAVDTYKPERGPLDGYISSVVSRALAMVAAELLAQCRQPFKQVLEADGTWRKVPINNLSLDDEFMGRSSGLCHAEHRTQESAEPLDESAETDWRDAAREAGYKSMSLAQRVDQLRLGSDAKQLLQIRLHTPPELWILARNLNRGRMKLEAQSICLYLGWVLGHNQPDRIRYQRATKELRDQLRYVLGVNELTFEPLKPILVTDRLALQTGAKQRSLEGLRS